MYAMQVKIEYQSGVSIVSCNWLTVLVPYSNPTEEILSAIH